MLEHTEGTPLCQLLIHNFWLYLLAMCVLLLAGVAKAVQMDAFERDLRSWDVIPSFVVTPAALIVPVTEVVIGLAWCLNIKRRLAAIAGVVFLLAVTALYIAQAILVAPPDCGCFGAWFRYERTRDVTALIVGRNTVLVGAILAGFIGLSHVQGRGPGRAAVGEARRLRPSGGNRSAFTITELLVTIAILATLSALLLRVLGTSRARGRDAVTLANLRSHVVNVAAYTNDWSGFYPAFTDATQHWTEFEFRGQSAHVRYFDMCFVWTIAMADAYYEGRWPHSSQQHPGGDHFCSYYYSASFLASPKYWNLETRTGPSQWVATRDAQLVYPSRKAVFVEIEGRLPTIGASLQGAVNLGLIDGSASRHSLSDLTPPIQSGDGFWEGSSFGIGIYGMHTPDGLAGIDVK